MTGEKTNGLPGLRRERMKAGLSKAGLAARIGSNRQNLTLWESLGSCPSAYWVPRIAEALGCTTDSLFKDDSEVDDETE